MQIVILLLQNLKPAAIYTEQQSQRRLVVRSQITLLQRIVDCAWIDRNSAIELLHKLTYLYRLCSAMQSQLLD